ncbi:MAG: ribonuclease HI [Gemmatimonadetes bacterium]|nr:ribonuclease HI [Gemmatimonadota bacterium]
MPEPPLVYIYADESCLGNQFQDRATPGGAAALIETWTKQTWVRRDFWTSEPDTTNNRMALASAIEPLNLLKRRCRVTFTSDSQYLIRGITEWLPAWRSRGWRRKGGPIENLDLWQNLDRAAHRHILSWSWIRGHAGHPQNEYANFLAIRAAREQTRSQGLVASAFEPWLERQRTERERFLDFFEFAPPEKERRMEERGST